MTPYVSIDIETTGLSPKTCQVLEIGAIIDDWREDVETLPKFRAIIKHDEIFGEPYALSMHPKLFKAIATIPAVQGELADPELDPLDPVNCMYHISDVTKRFLAFLEKNGMDMKVGFQPAGKNFASFDKPFLEAGVVNWKRDVKIKHRTIDPGNLYWLPGVEYLPDTKLCNERSGLPGFVAHTAVEDALGVVRQIRNYKANCDRVARNLASGTKFTEAFGMLQAALHPTLLVNVDDPMGMADSIIRYQKEGLPGDN